MCIVYCVCVSTYHMSLVAAPLRHLHMPRTQWQPRLLSGIAGLVQRLLEVKNGPDYEGCCMMLLFYLLGG